MAKWDLSKLPDGRKPLDDSWFRERAQMQERIKELEAKLAKAVDQTLDAASAYLKQQYGLGALSHPVDRGRIIAELKGESDE
jgi:aspartate/tyrosine/aromatic aminotransferase